MQGVTLDTSGQQLPSINSRHESGEQMPARPAGSLRPQAASPQRVPLTLRAGPRWSCIAGVTLRTPRYLMCTLISHGWIFHWASWRWWIWPQSSPRRSFEGLGSSVGLSWLRYDPIGALLILCRYFRVFKGKQKYPIDSAELLTESLFRDVQGDRAPTLNLRQIQWWYSKLWIPFTPALSRCHVWITCSAQPIRGNITLCLSAQTAAQQYKKVLIYPRRHPL